MVKVCTSMPPALIRPIRANEPAIDPEAPHDLWLTLAQAAVLIGVSRRTLYNWIRRGKLSVRRTAVGSPRVREADLWATQQAAK
jgi:excisionase family DNA binding protein